MARRKNTDVKNWNRQRMMQHLPFIFFLVIMAVYYGWRIVTIAPWYDELYTYKNFIDPGPLYAATHWPLPNNHVFFSVLSGILNFIGIPLVGLRGISYIAALLTVLLLYRYLLKFFSPIISTSAVILYAAMYNVATLSTQGRGYSLSCLLCLITVISLHGLCLEDKNKFQYTVGYILGLSLGLYTVPSNLYWVLPICMAGGFYLLVTKRWHNLLQLISKSILAAALTMVYYFPIWFVTGSNILGLESGSELFGKSRTYIFLHAPFLTIQKGIQYMLSDSNVQSTATMKDMILSMQYIIRDFLGNIYLNGGEILKWVTLLAMILVFIRFLLSLGIKNKNIQFICILSILTLLLVPVILTVQRVVPYVRVFVPLSILLSLLYATALDTAIPRKIAGFLAPVILVVAFVFLGFNLTSSMYNYGYEARDNSLSRLFEDQEWSGVDRVVWGDSYVEQQAYFYIASRQNKELTTDNKEPDCIIIDLETRDGISSAGWPYYYLYGDLPWDYMNSQMEITYEDDTYICYRRIE